MPGWLRSVLRNKRSLAGLSILAFYVLIVLLLAPTAPQRMVGRPHDPPSEQYVFGATRQGQDVFSQLAHGTSTTLRVGFLTGTIVMIIATAVGVTAGFVGGVTDEALSLITNIFLVVGGLPLIIVVASLIDKPGHDSVLGAE